MKTYLDCIPCFFKQALEASRIAGADPDLQKSILNEVAQILPSFSLSSSPPEMGKIIHEMVRRATNIDDPYKQIKSDSNSMALKIYPQLKKKVLDSKDRLLTAVHLAIAGNIIDFGAKFSLDVDDELKKILHKEKIEIDAEMAHLFNYLAFKKSLFDAEKILYLGDNAGETVFDKILIEEINSIKGDMPVVYAVKERPIINDAVESDAYDCGINTIAEVISSGSDAPGTIISLCSNEFCKIFREADMIISKGQGNFEALSDEKREIYFLFTAKCFVIARDVGCNTGESILLGGTII